MEQRGFRSVFVDLLDTAGTLAIQDRFGERASEQNEGAAEFANPATVTQPQILLNSQAGNHAILLAGFHLDHLYL